MGSFQNRLLAVLFLMTCIAAPIHSQGEHSQEARKGEPQKPKLSGELRITAFPATIESLGDRYLGTVRGSDYRFILNDGRGNRLVDIDAGWQKNPSASRDILLPEKSHFAGGFVLPLGKNLRFKQVLNRLWVDSSFGSDYRALGSYLAGYHWKLAWKFGREQDSKSTVLHYGVGEYRVRSDLLVTGGISFTQTKTGTVRKGVLRRGIGLSWKPPSARNHQFMGGVIGAFHASTRPTYVMGTGKCVDNKASGLNPNYILLYRNRAESQYALGIVTLSGKSLQCGVNESIFSAFMEGGLGPVRIVNNRNFDTLGVGGSYRTQEYGKMAFALSLGRTRITQTMNRSFADAEFYYTFDRKHTALFDPYVGLGYSGGEDVFFDHAASRPALKSLYSDSARVIAGAKFHLFEKTMRFAVTPVLDLRTGRP